MRAQASSPPNVTFPLQQAVTRDDARAGLLAASVPAPAGGGAFSAVTRARAIPGKDDHSVGRSRANSLWSGESAAGGGEAIAATSWGSEAAGGAGDEGTPPSRKFVGEAAASGAVCAPCSPSLSLTGRS